MDINKEYNVAPFAEIEYEPDINRKPAAAQALRFFSGEPGKAVSVGPQPIVQKAADPIREKFYEMRRLASDRPFARNDSELFYKQAKFMEDYTDNYDGGAKFFMYFPYYQHMGYEQLRTYFTWRAKVRRGEVLPTATSYAFLYVYELLSGIGADSPADGLNKLMVIWDEFLKYGPALENYMPRWIKDYHIYYELPHSFADFIKTRGMEKYYSLTLLFDSETGNNLELWNSVSGYDVTQSKFYNEGNQQLFGECFDFVLSAIHGFCEKKDKRFDDLFIYKISNRNMWTPFKSALFHPRGGQSDRTVSLPGRERYYCKNDRWTAKLPIYYSNYKDYASYIVKKTESCLREAVKYKYTLKAELKIRGGYYKELAAAEAELDRIIEKAVADYFREKNRTVVTVDHANLARIREEALETQEALAVPEGVAGAVNAESRILNAEMDDVGKSDGSVATPESSGASNMQVLLTELSDPATDGWQALKEALTTMELKALALVLEGSVNLKAFADENGIMLEVLLDSINEKASDYIGDNIMETGDEINVYDEYRESISEIAPTNPLQRKG